MDNTAPPAVGRGRGRGEAVLPQGLWDELSGLGNDKQADDVQDLTRYDDRPDDARRKEHNFSENFDEDSFIPPMGFGRGRGGARGAFGGRGGGGRGCGLEKDMKGPDWTCASCSNVNWSWRASCNKCNTAKPNSVLAEPKEVRDGAGGGFNERQSRVSTASVEITEDGFDDFGRRAKGRSDDKKAKEAAALARLQSNYGFLLNPSSFIQSTENPTTNPKSNLNANPSTDSNRKEESQRDTRGYSFVRDGRKRSRSREANHHSVGRADKDDDRRSPDNGSNRNRHKEHDRLDRGHTNRHRGGGRDDYERR